jgi:uncharacterized protein
MVDSACQPAPEESITLPADVLPPVTATRLAPVLERERILLLDVLRGIALLGVCVANVWLWFSGIAFRFPGYREELLRLSPDSVVFFGIAIVISGKAMSTFSFLFGLGFAVQMLRAQARGRSVVPVYLRRLIVLLLIGLAHMTLLWYGDILAAYAALGFPLLLFRNRKERTLLVWAAILMVAVPLLLGGIPWILTAAGFQLPTPDLAEITRRNATTLSIFQNGPFGAIVGENLHQAGMFYAGRKAPWLLYILGLFLLGLYAGRRRIFENTARYRAVFRRIAMWGLPIGLAASVTMSVLQTMLDPAAVMARPWLILLTMTVFVVGTVPLAAGYVSAATLLFDTPVWRDRLAAFAPVGRMALTNYLTQTVVMLLVFYPYGGGLIGRTGPAAGLAIALAAFAAQMVLSELWLTRFRFGPIEWLWRALTYGARPPMRLPRGTG